MLFTHPFSNAREKERSTSQRLEQRHQSRSSPSSLNHRKLLQRGLRNKGTARRTLALSDHLRRGASGSPSTTPTKVGQPGNVYTEKGRDKEELHKTFAVHRSRPPCREVSAPAWNFLFIFLGKRREKKNRFSENCS